MWTRLKWGLRDLERFSLLTASVDFEDQHATPPE